MSHMSEEDLLKSLQGLIKAEEELINYMDKPMTDIEKKRGVEHAYYEGNEGEPESEPVLDEVPLEPLVEPRPKDVPTPKDNIEKAMIEKVGYDIVSTIVDALNRRKYTKPFYLSNASQEDFEIFLRETLLELVYDTIPSRHPNVSITDYALDYDKKRMMLGVQLDTSLGIITAILISNYGDAWQLVDYSLKEAKSFEPLPQDKLIPEPAKPEPPHVFAPVLVEPSAPTPTPPSESAPPIPSVASEVAPSNVTK